MADPLVNSQIGLASPSSIIQNLAAFSAKPMRDWLPINHPARNGQILDPATGRNVRRLDQARLQLTDDQFVMLVAACGPGHCLDGWGYLSRSVNALVARDGHSAKHMAYYAQLRAAMSMLAISGVGIFNCLNICIDSNGRVHKLEDAQESKNGRNTHSVVWPALDAWLRIDANAARFLSSVQLSGTNLKEAIDSIWPNRQPASVVVPLINAWAFDLSVASKHHEQRNISSYTPHDLNEITCSFKDEMEFLSEVWGALEPSLPSGFGQLDKHILRRMFQMVHRQDNDAVEPEDTVSLAESPVAARYEELEPTLKLAVPKGFLLDEALTSEPKILQFASTDGNTPRAMIARAVLLLRAATAMTTLALKDAGFSPFLEEIRPWLDPLLLHRGIVTPETMPEKMADLWDSTQYAVEDFIAKLAASSYEPHVFFHGGANGTPDVTQFERAGMWGICP